MRNIEPHLIEESDLLRRAQDGDLKAFEELYHCHVGRVHALCLRMAGDKRVAEELTQDVFVQVWKSVNSFRGESRFSTWLHRIAVNTVLARYRSESWRADNVETEDEVHEQASQSVDVPQSMDLESAIQNLPLQAKQVFVLHDVEGYRHEEIAEMMGIVIGTSKSQLHRARRLLRGALKC